MGAAGAAGVGAPGGIVGGTGGAATFGAGVAPVLLPWEAEEYPVFWGREVLLQDVWLRPLP